MEECNNWNLSIVQGTSGNRLSTKGLAECICKKVDEGYQHMYFAIPRIVLDFGMRKDPQMLRSIFSEENIQYDASRLLSLQSQSSTWKLKTLQELYSDTAYNIGLEQFLWVCHLFAGSTDDTLACVVLIRWGNSLLQQDGTAIAPIFDAPCFTKTILLDQPRSATNILQKLFETSQCTDHDCESWSKIYSSLTFPTGICDSNEAEEILIILKALMGFVSIPPATWKCQQLDADNIVDEDLVKVATLLKISDLQLLRSVISSKSLRIKREVNDILIALNDAQIVSRIDTIVCDIYHLVFQFLIQKINLLCQDHIFCGNILPLPYAAVLASNGFSPDNLIGDFESLMKNYADERLHQYFTSIDHENVLVSLSSFSNVDKEFPVTEGKNGLFDILEEISLGPMLADVGSETLTRRLTTHSHHPIVVNSATGKSSVLSNTILEHPHSQRSSELLFAVSHYHQNVIYCASDMISKNRCSDFHVTKKLLALSSLSLSETLSELLQSYGSGDEGTVKSGDTNIGNSVDVQFMTRGRLQHQKFAQEVKGLVHYLQQHYCQCDTLVDVASFQPRSSSSVDIHRFLEHNSFLSSVLLSNHNVMQLSLRVDEFLSTYGRYVDIFDGSGADGKSLVVSAFSNSTSFPIVAHAVPRLSYFWTHMDTNIVLQGVILTLLVSEDVLWLSNTSVSILNEVVLIIRQRAAKRIVSALQPLAKDVEQKLSKSSISVLKRFIQKCFVVHRKKLAEMNVCDVELAENTAAEEKTYSFMFDKLTAVEVISQRFKKSLWIEECQVFFRSLWTKIRGSMSVMTATEKTDAFLFCFAVLFVSQL